ncbi:MAG: hypothetical protein KJO55_09995 [Gammaproteobacteria bacterium]|nr:hypothetical protein [Gammaproteobacteria bacterium]
MRDRSQFVQPLALIVWHMEEKYYTHFLLMDGSHDGYTEFSGIVEVMRYTGECFEDDEVRDMLADNLEVEADDVTILQWSRLH